MTWSLEHWLATAVPGRGAGTLDRMLIDEVQNFQSEKNSTRRVRCGVNGCEATVEERRRVPPSRPSARAGNRRERDTQHHRGDADVHGRIGRLTSFSIDFSARQEQRGGGADAMPAAATRAAADDALDEPGLAPSASRIPCSRRCRRTLYEVTP